MNKVSIWNIALTHEEIQTLMLTQLIGNEEGLVCYLNFNEGSGNFLNEALFK